MTIKQEIKFKTDIMKIKEQELQNLTKLLTKIKDKNELEYFNLLKEIEIKTTFLHGTRQKIYSLKQKIKSK